MGDRRFLRRRGRFGTGGRAGLADLGSLDESKALTKEQFVMTVATPHNPKVRGEIEKRLGLEPNRFASVIHPSSAIAATTQIGSGTILLAGVTTTADVSIGRHVVVMPRVVFTHDNRCRRLRDVRRRSAACGRRHDRRRRIHRLGRVRARRSDDRRGCPRRHGQRRHTRRSARRGLVRCPGPPPTDDAGRRLRASPWLLRKRRRRRRHAASGPTRTCSKAQSSVSDAIFVTTRTSKAAPGSVTTSP